MLTPVTCVVDAAVPVAVSVPAARTDLCQPIGSLVEEIDGVRLVYGKVNLEEELLILLHSHYPDYVALKDIQETTKQRNSGSVGNKLRDLVKSVQSFWSVTPRRDTS
jgi:hypothetical protein